MKVRILVRLKDGVTDAPGRVVTEQLRARGFFEVAGVNLGKLVELDLEGADRDTIGTRIKQMCSQVLVNAGIEDYEILS